MNASIISAGVAGISALANTLVGSSANANLNATNRRWQTRMSKLAYIRQRELTVDQYQLNKQGMINAGISPAAMQGYNGGSASLATGTPSPSSIPEYVPFDLSSVLAAANLSNQTKVAEAQSRDTNAKAEAQELENQKTKAEMHEWQDQTAKQNAYFYDDDGTLHKFGDKDFDDAVQAYIKSHNGSLPDTHITNSHIISANQAMVSKTLSDINAAIARNDNDIVQSKFAKQVSLHKMADPDIMHAIYNMDSAQFNQITKMIDKISSDIDVNKTVQDYNNAKTAEARQSIEESIARTALIKTQDANLKNSSLSNLVDSLVGAKDVKSGLIAIGKLILSILFGNTPSGIVKLSPFGNNQSGAGN